MSRSHTPFRFSLTIGGFTDDLQVLSFSGEEALSTPYAFDLVLVSGVAMAVEAGMEVTVKAGAHVVLSAGACISLMAGGQHLLVSAAGIYVSSPILLGGVPIPGTAALPAITSDLAPLTAAVLTPTQINSLKRNAPFCEECEKCKGGACDISIP